MASLNTLRTSSASCCRSSSHWPSWHFILSEDRNGLLGQRPACRCDRRREDQLFGVLRPVRDDQVAEQHAGERRAAVGHAGQCRLAGADRQIRADSRFRPDGPSRYRAGTSGDGQRTASFAGFLQCFRRSPHGRVQRGCHQPVPRAGRDQPRGGQCLGAAQRAGPHGARGRAVPRPGERAVCMSTRSRWPAVPNSANNTYAGQVGR